jgi:putative AlgH/UPF0301 family transcriptional regulator
MNYSYKGKILISTPDISGDIFSRSVVLIIEHDESGAYGMILNKKNHGMSSKLLEIFGFNVEVYEGGPVENDRISLSNWLAPQPEYPEKTFMFSTSNFPSIIAETTSSMSSVM